MKVPPHWSQCQDEIAAAWCGPARVLAGLDFDGTLAPIVERAADAAAPPQTLQAVAALARSPGVQVAVVSGRSLDDVRGRLGGCPSLIFAGNHGLELEGPDWSDSPADAEWRRRLEDALAALGRSLAKLPGAWVEDKRLTASIHFRETPPERHSEVESAVRQAAAAHQPMEVRAGKCVWELRPPGERHKGWVMRTLAAKLDLPAAACAFLGDDVTDEDAFREIDGPLTFLVGERPSAARCRLEDPAEVPRLLEWLAALRQPGGS